MTEIEVKEPKKDRRGGARVGAGRPRSPVPLKQFNILLPEHVIKAIKERGGHRFITSLIEEEPMRAELLREIEPRLTKTQQEKLRILFYEI